MEKLKGLILLYLVIQSMVFTYTLWYAPSDYEEVAFTVEEPYIFQEAFSVEEAVKPGRIIYTQEEDEYWIIDPGKKLHTSIWDNTYSWLKEGRLRRTEGELDDLFEQTPDLALDFVLPFPVEFWEAPFIEERIEEILAVEVYAEDEGLFFLVQGEEKEVLVVNESGNAYGNFRRQLQEIKEAAPLYGRREAEFLNEYLGEAAAAESGFYFLPMEPLSLSRLKLVREEITAENLINAMFLDLEVVRRIEIKEREQIYTDGKEYLHFTGENLEFSSPPAEGGEVSFSYGQALQKATEYLCHYGGWPDKLQLQHAEFRREEAPLMGEAGHYLVKWRYFHEGLPLLDREVNMKFNDRGLVNYFRPLWVPRPREAAEVESAPVEEVLEEIGDICRELWNDQEEGEESSPLPESEGGEEVEESEEEAEQEKIKLQEIYLSYYISDRETGMVEPAWVVRLEEEVLILQADNLNILYRGEGGDEFFSSP